MGYGQVRTRHNWTHAAVFYKVAKHASLQKSQNFYNWIESTSISWEEQRYRLNGYREGKSFCKSESVKNAREAAIDEFILINLRLMHLTRSCGR